MNSQNAIAHQNQFSRCIHGKPGKDGLALITIGNQLRGDDGIAAALCDALPESALQDVCRYDLGTYTGYLSDCLAGHQAAIIIDATYNGTASGTVTLMDLSSVLANAVPMNIQSCHGLSLADELRLAKKEGGLPKRIIFFGIEVNDVDWSDTPSPTLKRTMPAFDPAAVDFGAKGSGDC